MFCFLAEGGCCCFVSTGTRREQLVCLVQPCPWAVTQHVLLPLGSRVTSVVNSLSPEAVRFSSRRLLEGSCVEHVH